MKLVDQHIVNKNNPLWVVIDQLCFQSKNLYNSALYKIKQEYLISGRYLRYIDLEKIFREENNVDYFAIPTATSQQILRLLDQNVKSFFGLLKAYKSNKKSLNGCPRFLKYKDKLKGRNVYIVRGDTIRYSDGYLIFPKRLNLNPIKTINITNRKQINQIRFIPGSGCYKIEIVYDKHEQILKENNAKYCTIDLGVNNLTTLTTNISELIPLIINGKIIKSINQQFNKRKSKIQSELKKNHNKYNSKKLNNLQLKRDNKIKDYLHKTSRIVVNYLLKNDINTLIIGYNKEWKNNINIGKKNNQIFIQIPYNNLLNMLEYKCKLEGINVIINEESYTSKCSSLDLEPVSKKEEYVGKRIKRGLFRTKEGKLINSDVNGSLNIGRKVIGDVYIPSDTGFVFNPIKINSL
jgi:putative transposase